ncbi:MarR family transcriptional regulator (plasmid) [Arthrobacter agilis]|uniref:MarR family winged helix-turn-helix transcriptional regulator n=1 Tax=Arthrobacter agilis TaxID=37921 RepID=UPI00236595C1|nr:MarR family transcriptional regulator [Arthrobacter agilis]WDF35113.1 MarR family transcriptional regulator [Arthrobacter agilis]
MSRVDALDTVESELSCLWRRERALSLHFAGRIHPTLGPGSYRLLIIVLQRAPIRVTDIAIALDVRKATISRRIAHLEGLGLITRHTDSGDRWAHFLDLTAEGARTVTAVQRQRQAEFQRTFLQWAPADVADLVSLLDRLNTMRMTDV